MFCPQIVIELLIIDLCQSKILFGLLSGDVWHQLPLELLWVFLFTRLDQISFRVYKMRLPSVNMSSVIWSATVNVCVRTSHNRRLNLLNSSCVHSRMIQNSSDWMRYNKHNIFRYGILDAGLSLYHYIRTSTGICHLLSMRETEFFNSC